MDLGNLQPTASASIGDLVGGETGKSGESRAADTMGAASQAGRGLLAQNHNDKFNSGLSYGDNATVDAIRSKYDQQYGQNEQKLSHDTLLKANTDRLKSLQVTSQLASEEVEQNRQKEILKWKQQQAKRAARAAMVGSVLGLVGAAGGAVAGGPAGAGVGMAGGQAVGNLAGGM